ncbi:MAG: DUF378 domain-containing protein [Parcubacteria group bacterium CG10_big_fil_rev_8_21_14_0_10_41_35]|nr:MAG: DUF378 domain-containing protein [Parcubacteria group bacterium CG10_big_fil_rev_8_21_14_0_10_41_35]
MKSIHIIAVVLLVFGGLSWGIIALTGWELLGGMDANISKVVYILVGLSALYEIVMHKKTCKVCS